MQSFIFLKHTPNLSVDAAHVYEHLFIESFRDLVSKKLEINDAVIGYLGGETFENIVFVEGWFYDDRISELFLSFIANETLNSELLDTVLSQCEAEERCKLEVENSKQLINELTMLAKSPWEDATTLPVMPYNNNRDESIKPPVHRVKNAKGFKSITISPYFTDASNEDIALFKRFSVILHDIIGHFVRNHGWYEQSSFSIQQKEQHTHIVLGVTLKKGELTNKEIEDTLEKYFRSFDLNKNYPYIKAHFESYMNQPTWVGHIREDLHYIDVLAGSKTITKLATKENIERLLNNVEIKVENVSFSFAKDIRY